MKSFLFIFLLSLPLAAQLRINPRGFEVPENEIRPLLESVIKTFAYEKLPPILVVRGHEGPITLYERTGRGEVVIQLDTHRRYWAQYVYQFAHELAHVAARFQAGHHPNKWLEETLCETASLYALRKMGLTWRDHPPLPQLRSFSPHLQKYADTVIASREKITVKDLPAFYQKHQESLRKSATRRSLNGAIANVLLPFFEAKPDHWKILASLNSFPRKKDLPLSDFLKTWSAISPEQAFIPELKKLFLP